MIPGYLSHPLHAPLLPWLQRDVASLDELNREASACGLTTGSGSPLQFVPPFVPPGDSPGYEHRAYLLGEVETRPDNWHDLFGAWIWFAFPRSKALMNRRHWLALQAESGGRGPLRDALTQFDECGMVVLCTDPSLWQGIREHRWREVFVQRRAEVAQHLRFLLFGHGSHDALRAPYTGLCAKALCFDVAALPDELPAQVALADQLLADFLTANPALTPRCWQPLPLLGIPGANADNENPGYYDDTRQFRPARAVAKA